MKEMNGDNKINQFETQYKMKYTEKNCLLTCLF